MKFKKQYEQYVNSIQQHEFSTGSPVDYTTWLESLLMGATVEIEVSGGVASLVSRPPHVWVIIRNYDNYQDHDENEQEYSEDVYMGWLSK